MTTAPVRLSTWPTPLDPAPRLAAALGLGPDELWVKRDDLTSFAGGNKVRKLEHLVGAAEADGATALVTTGGLQSNHARLTAAAAARAGAAVGAGARRRPATGPRGNLLLDELSGAASSGPAGEDVDERVADGAELRTAGEVPAVCPLGGSTPTGARRLPGLRRELAEQLPGLDTAWWRSGPAGPWPAWSPGSAPSGCSGWTPARCPTRRARHRLATALGATVGELRLRRDQVGEGYGALTDAAAAAMTTAARTEGLVLDPVYTGKALAGLAAAVRRLGAAGARTVFLHTGGLPGLFGHPYAAQLAGGAPRPPGEQRVPIARTPLTGGGEHAGRA